MQASIDYTKEIQTVRKSAKQTGTLKTLRTLLIYWPSADYMLARISEYESRNGKKGLLNACMKAASKRAEEKRNTVSEDQGVTFCKEYLNGLLAALRKRLKLKEDQLIEDIASPFANWLLKDGDG